jgi:hypothetical protein
MNPGEILQYTHARAPLCGTSMDCLLRVIEAARTERLSDAESHARDLADAVEYMRADLEDAAWEQDRNEAREEYAHQRAVSAYLGVG